MPEYVFDLERSDYYKNRASLLKSNGIPKLSDAKVNLGDSLSKVVFEECEDALKVDFGLNDPLKGPGNTLWVSPSDLLLGKIALKPPFTPKCLQALTHKGILEIGEDIEIKFRNQMELDKQQALDKLRTDLLATEADRMKLEIKEVELRERLSCQMEMEKQRQEFEVNLKQELDKLEQNIREQYEQIIAKRDADLEAQWEQKLQEEVKKTVDAMTKQYLAQLDQQEQKMTELFKLELKKQELLRQFDARLHNHKRTEALRQLKHNLECTNLVNMMYVLCTERQKCCDQKAAIESRYKAEINALEDKIGQKVQLLRKVKAEKERQIKEVAIREACLTEVLKQFQKFINFALRSAPAQAEFLLSVEKMMIFELTNEIAKADIKPSVKKEAPAIISWMHDGKSMPPSVKSSGLELLDHHDCFRELNPPVKEELGEDDALPAIYFNNKTYVREDFRDMLAGGITLTPSNELWNKDVEILVDNWRQGADEEPAAKNAISSEKEIALEKLDEGSSLQEADRRRSTKSTVQFADKDNGSLNSRGRRLSAELRIKSSLKPGSYPCLDDIQFTSIQTPSKLLAAKDSLDLLLEQEAKKTASLEIPEEHVIHRISDVSETEQKLRLSASSPPSAGSRRSNGKELVCEVKDSVIMRMSEMGKTQSSAEFMAIPKDSLEVAKDLMAEKVENLYPKMSKLSCARNSVEILKESLQKLKMSSLICHRKDYKKQEHKDDKVFLGYSGTCCDRCKRKEDMDLDSRNDSMPDNGDERSVKISRIQIINLDDHVPTSSAVSFSNQPIFYKDTETPKHKHVPVEAKSTMTGSSKSTKRKSQKQKRKPPQSRVKVVGDMNAQEGSQTTDEFTADRIHSLVELMRDQPHLLRLFTAGIQ